MYRWMWMPRRQETWILYGRNLLLFRICFIFFFLLIIARARVFSEHPNYTRCLIISCIAYENTIYLLHSVPVSQPAAPLCRQMSHKYKTHRSEITSSISFRSVINKWTGLCVSIICPCICAYGIGVWTDRMQAMWPNATCTRIYVRFDEYDECDECDEYDEIAIIVPLHFIDSEIVTETVIYAVTTIVAALTDHYTTHSHSISFVYIHIRV